MSKRMLGQTQLKQEIGKRLKEAREAAGYLSVEQFCETFKLELEKYLAHETGKQSLRASDAIVYSRIFKKPVQWLMLLELQNRNE